MHKKHIVSQTQKAMFSVLKRSRELELPIDLQLELFDSLVLPILLYSVKSEGSKISKVKKSYIWIFKSILCLKPSTPTCMVLGDKGRFPLSLYWLQPGWFHYCLNSYVKRPKKLSIIYSIICHIHFMSIIYIQMVIVYQHFVHNWLSTVNNSPLCVFYRTYRDSFEQYIILY